MMRCVRGFVVLMVLVLQCGCYVAGYETEGEVTAVSESDGKYAFHLALEARYSVHLDSTWTRAEAAALLRAFTALPSGLDFRFSTWRVGESALPDGIAIADRDGARVVTVSRALFEEPETVDAAWTAGKRLYYAVVLFATEQGTDRGRIEALLRERYGIGVTQPSDRVSGSGDPVRYSAFTNSDLMLIISAFEMFPAALHKIPQLTYIVRKVDTEVDRGKSTAHVSRGYIAFAESMFARGYVQDTRRVIAHEKSHFLWHYVLGHGVKENWTTLGGWHRDPNSESGWSPGAARESFVSDYAYSVNPNEDMAERIAYYLLWPDRLRACSPAKYEFIDSRIMSVYGTGYASVGDAM